MLNQSSYPDRFIPNQKLHFEIKRAACIWRSQRVQKKRNLLVWVTVVQTRHIVYPLILQLWDLMFIILRRKSQEGLWRFSYPLMQEKVLTLVVLDPPVTSWFLDLPSCVSHRENEEMWWEWPLYLEVGEKPNCLALPRDLAQRFCSLILLLCWCQRWKLG